MSQIITDAFASYWQQCLIDHIPVELDEFVLANIPGLDPDADIDPGITLPPDTQIVHRQAVDQIGKINLDTVAYSIVMDTSVGDFSFNAMYLINAAGGFVAMAVHKRAEDKWHTDESTGQLGNSVVKTMQMEYDRASEATATHVDASTWQIDYAARLRGLDEDMRLQARQFFGPATFYDDGFLLTNAAGSYGVQPGLAYVGGLRVSLGEAASVTPTAGALWLDVYRAGSLLSAWENHAALVFADELADYVDGAGYQHYVAKIADIAADGSVTDARRIASVVLTGDAQGHGVLGGDGMVIEVTVPGKMDISAYKPRADALMATELPPNNVVGNKVDMDTFEPGHMGYYGSEDATHCPSKYNKITFHTETRAIVQSGTTLTFLQTAQPINTTDSSYAAAYRIGTKVGDAAATFSAWIYQYDTANPVSYDDIFAAYVSSNFNAYHGKQRIASNGAYPSSEGVWYISNCGWAPEPYGIMAIFINGQSDYAGGHILGHDSAQVAIFLARDTGKFYTGSLPINSGLEAWVWCDSNYPIPPIGSVLFFKDATINPATIYAGTTWARIATNQNIRGAADGEAGGTAGGSDIVALTTNELPPHIHGTEAHAHTGENHAHHIFLKDDLEGGSAGADSRLAASVNSSSSGGSNTYSDYTMAPGTGTSEVGITSSAAGNTGAAAPNTLSAGSGAAFSVLNAFIKLHIWERTS